MHHMHENTIQLALARLVHTDGRRRKEKRKIKNLTYFIKTLRCKPIEL